MKFETQPSTEEAFGDTFLPPQMTAKLIPAGKKKCDAVRKTPLVSCSYPSTSCLGTTSTWRGTMNEVFALLGIMKPG